MGNQEYSCIKKNGEKYFLCTIPITLVCDNAVGLALEAPPSHSLLSVMFEMLYEKALHDAYGITSALL